MSVLPLRFWGTGAAEAIPDPFCRCPVCEHARCAGGKEIRSRSMFRLSESIAIDAGPDFVLQSHLCGEDLYHLRHVLYTHTHADHFSAALPSIRSMAIQRASEPVTLYLTDEAFTVAEKWREGFPSPLQSLKTQEDAGLIRFEKLEYFKTYDLEGTAVTPLPGHHRGDVEPFSANYLLRLPDGRMLYYAADTGRYLPQTLSYLKDVHLDIWISECTFAVLDESRKKDYGGHMGIESFLETLHQLFAQNTLSENSRVFITHINHYGGGHQALCDYFAGLSLPCKVTVAYDGLAIE